MLILQKQENGIGGLILETYRKCDKKLEEDKFNFCHVLNASEGKS